MTPLFRDSSKGTVEVDTFLTSCSVEAGNTEADSHQIQPKDQSSVLLWDLEF